MYTGKHLKGCKTIKHTKTDKYYIIAHPYEVNIHTGNACVTISNVIKYDKNFIFEYLDENDKIKTILISKRHVLDNIFPCRKNIYDDEGNLLNRKFFYMIKIKDIFDFGKEININSI